MNAWMAGDVTISGILLTAAYLICGALCWHCARQSAVAPGAGIKAVERARFRYRFWLAAAVVLVLIGVERQLGVLTLLANHGRTLLFRGGLYYERRAIQLPLVLALAGLGLMGLVIAVIANRRRGWPILLALVGMAVLLSFTLVRAVSLHSVDGWLDQAWRMFTVANGIELAGILVTAGAAWGFVVQVRGERRVERLRMLSIEQRRRRLRDERRAREGGV